MTNDDNLYHVQVIETDASIRCGLKPFIIYHLIIESNQLQLKIDHQLEQQQPQSSSSSNILFEWPYKYVRRYGYTSNSISFEAGSKCKTGEGLFIFRNKKSKILYNQITNFIELIKQKNKIIDDNNNNNIVNDKRKSLIENINDDNGINKQQQQISHLIVNGCQYAKVIKK